MSILAANRAAVHLAPPLTDAELAALFRPLSRDYARIVAATSHLTNAERAPLVLERIEAYSAAFSDAIVQAVDDATAATLGQWARGGR